MGEHVMGLNGNHIIPFLWMRGEDRSIIQEEMGKIAECGIHAVCVEARPHDDYCGPLWWRDLSIVIEEAKKHDMKVWILDDRHFPTGFANGKIRSDYPERKKMYLACSRAEVFGSDRTLSLNINRMLKPAIGFWEIGKPVDENERARNELVAIVACPLAEGKKLHESELNLTWAFDGEWASFRLPAGAWRVSVLYRTRTDGGNDSYINMADSVSAHTQIEAVYEPHYENLKEEFGRTIAGFFSDEPQFGNTADISYDTKPGKAGMVLPWSDELESMLSDRFEEDFRNYLPYLFEETAEDVTGRQIRFDYMDCVSLLYQKNFSDVIGKWCEEHGVEYIGHVVEDNHLHSRLGMGAGHYFRAMSGQHMAGIDCIGEQVIFGGSAQERIGMGMTGGDGEFYHYVLGKLGASAGHLDPKKKGRTMCELFGAYGWNFGVRDMRYVLDHMLVKGVNYLVPHAFSMAEYPDPDCPPHFYARGNNPQFRAFAYLMRYAERMCCLLSGGKHIAQTAVLYDAENDWIGGRDIMKKICRLLTEKQIEFDIVSLDMLRVLKKYRGSLKDGILEINGIRFHSLIVGCSPEASCIPAALAEFAESASRNSFPVFFTPDKPESVLRKAGIHVAVPEMMKNVPLKMLPGEIRRYTGEDAELSVSSPDISTFHYELPDGTRIRAFMNESAKNAYCGEVILPYAQRLYCYDGFRDLYQRMPYRQKDASAAGEKAHVSVLLELERGESIFLTTSIGGNTKSVSCKEEQLPVHESFREQVRGGKVTDISSGWYVSCARPKEYPLFGPEKEEQILYPFSDTNPKFSGVIRYRRKVEILTRGRVFLRAESVGEIMRVLVNGEEAGIRLTPPYQTELTDFVSRGMNEITVEVMTTPARDQLNYQRPSFDFTYDPVDSTGLYGKIELIEQNQNAERGSTYGNVLESERGRI